MPSEGQAKIRFTNCRPGKIVFWNFELRHKDYIKLGNASRQEALRYRVTNGENLTTHFTEMVYIFKKYQIDSTRIVNIDEAGCSPNRDANGRMRAKTFSTRSKVAQYRSAYFKNVHRVTVLPTIFACGNVGKPTFVVQGASLAYRVIKVGEKKQLESIADYLPPHAHVTTRKELAEVDSFIFKRWAESFVEYCRPLTANYREVLLVYDGYRSHMGLKVLENFREGNVIAYGLP